MNITDWISAISTVILVLVTIYYAYQAYYLAKITNSKYEEERRPYLAFESISSEFNCNPENTLYSGRLGIVLHNVGATLLKYEVELVEVDINGLKLKDPKFDNKGGYVYPNQFNIFFYDTFEEIPIKNFPINGSIEYKINYWRYDSSRIFTTYKYLNIFIDPKQITWKFIKEEEN